MNLGGMQTFSPQWDLDQGDEYIISCLPRPAGWLLHPAVDVDLKAVCDMEIYHMPNRRKLASESVQWGRT